MSITPARALASCLFAFQLLHAHGQCNRWQQRVKYDMRVDLDARTHRFTGSNTLVYTNNSPDALREVFFHRYFNAFRPGSEMDVRSRTIADPDERVGSRIAALAANEVGEQRVDRMMQSGKAVQLEPMGTVLKAVLAQPLLPGKSTTLVYDFSGQVPVQIRRSGRDNAEGVAYSMTQWYPKLAEYDERGWHAYPYVGREFYGVWGDFDVAITLDSSFTIAATGVLQNPEQIGHGYATGKKPLKRASGEKLVWHFNAKNVHDFAWAADPQFIHATEQMPNGPMLHFFRKNDPELKATWDQLPGYMVKSFTFMNEHFGKYQWPQYSFVQGGDGGMEYPMMTLITGKRRLGSLVGVSVHESVHSWYYGMLASNEGRFAWMDEGFTEYASSDVMKFLFDQKDDPHASAFDGYKAMAESGKHEPPSVHADHFTTNRAYGATAYSFGEMFVNQLGAVVGEKTLAQGMLRYFDACKFHHPGPIDFERAMEKQSGLELDWYFDEWINTTRHLDQAISEVVQVNDELRITVENKGDQLMPVEMEVTFRDGKTSLYFIPLSLMRGSKSSASENHAFTTLPTWQWTDPSYSFTIPGALAQVSAITIDPHKRMADMDRENNTVILEAGTGGVVKP
ncbi:MAG TPA: M1 family metallopeptidase, partial [Flavobacteriales bacterium]|nr:M1 family metallopeptidase [Flavobacteriales bacterium]